MAAGGGGAWKVAYADFVTAMMAFFMVMWITAQNKPVKEAIAAYFKDPIGASPKPSSSGRESAGGGDKQFQGPRKLPAVVDPEGIELKKGKFKTPRGRKPMIMMKGSDGTAVGTVIRFEVASADLSDVGKSQLREFVPALLGKSNKIEIRGHCVGLMVNSPDGDDKSWRLCYERCQGTMDYLVAQGVKPQRIRLSQAAANEPFTTSADRAAQQENSRIEVYLLGEFSEDSATLGDMNEVEEREAENSPLLPGNKKKKALQPAPVFPASDKHGGAGHVPVPSASEHQH